MHQLSVVADTADRAQIIAGQLAGTLTSHPHGLQELSTTVPAPHAIVDVNLKSSTTVQAVRAWLSRAPRRGKVIVAVGRGSRSQAVQAYAMGATDIVERPLQRERLLPLVFGPDGAFLASPPPLLVAGSDGVAHGIGALQNIFAAVVSGAPVDVAVANAAADTITAQIEGDGIRRWIEIVRQHHSLTYQHCLLVTGIAVGFGQQLGFSAKDRGRLALGGLLHDLGKAGLPLAILEKPGPLTRAEYAIVQQHPQIGFEALQDATELEPEMLDIVVHHHEYLDGSGYPHRLSAGSLSDLVRIMTIADIFGALIEYRPYKAPMPPEAAIQILEDMGPKLDGDLVRAFKPFARMQAIGH